MGTNGTVKDWRVQAPSSGDSVVTLGEHCLESQVFLLLRIGW